MLFPIVSNYIANWLPTDIAGLDLWLNEDGYSGSNGTAISTWTDQSGSGNDASQGNASFQPTIATAAVGGHDALDWTEATDYMTITKTSWGANVTMFAVAKKTATASIYNGAFFDAGTDIYFSSSKGLRFDRTGNDFRLGVAGVSSGNGSFVTQSDTDGTYEILVATYDGTTMSLFKNGTAGSTSTAESGDINYTGVTSTLIGSHYGPNNELGGQLAVVGCYNSSLSTADREKLEGYLAHHYGLEANLPGGHTYKSSPP